MASQFRRENPTARTLDQSLCVIVGKRPAFRPSAAQIADLTRLLPKSLDIDLQRQSDNWSLELPHEAIDAFALLNGVEDATASSDQISYCASESGSQRGIHATNEWITRWRVANTDNIAKKSFIRRFVEAIAQSLSADTIVSIPVLMDAEECKDLRYYSGVGFGSALLSCGRVKKMAGLAHAEWKLYLRDRALASIRAIQSRAREELLVPNFVVSSLGNFGSNWPRLKIHPSSFTIFSTPVSPATPHIVLWASETHRVATVCRKIGCVTQPCNDLIFDCWRQL